MKNYFFRKYKECIDSTSYSDILEKEADRITFQLLSRSCVDIREVAKFVSKCHKLTENQKQSNECFKRCYINKHNFNEHKVSFIEHNMTKFIDFRAKCGCPPFDK